MPPSHHASCFTANHDSARAAVGIGRFKVPDTVIDRGNSRKRPPPHPPATTSQVIESCLSKPTNKIRVAGSIVRYIPGTTRVKNRRLFSSLLPCPEVGTVRSVCDRSGRQGVCSAGAEERGRKRCHHREPCGICTSADTPTSVEHLDPVVIGIFAVDSHSLHCCIGAKHRAGGGALRNS